MSIYEDQGYADRDDYLRNLADGFGLDTDIVFMVADMLGPNEDFDGLITTLEDYAEGWY